MNWKLVPQRTWSGPLSRGVEAGQGGPRIREHPAHHGNRVVGQQGVGMQHADDRCLASCTPRLIAAARPRVSCRTTSSPAASAMGDGGGFSIKKEGTPASFRLLQRLIDYGIATGYLRGRTVQRTSG